MRGEVVPDELQQIGILLLLSNLGEQAREAATNRTPLEQIEFWAKLGRSVEAVLSFPSLKKLCQWTEQTPRLGQADHRN